MKTAEVNPTPGSIQPHGFFLALSPDRLKILQVSQNIGKLFQTPAESLLGQGLENFLSTDDFTKLQAFVRRHQFKIPQAIELNRKFPDAKYSSDLWIFHRTQQGLLVDIEPPPHLPSNPEVYNAIRTIGSLALGSSIKTICQAAVDHVRALTGFDRVLVYQMSTKGYHEALAESLGADVESFLSRREAGPPALSAQAQQVLIHNWVRTVPSVHAPSVALVPELSPIDQKPLDITRSTLRTPSQLYADHLTNYGVESNLALSVVIDGHLWGMIICQHPKPLFVHYNLRVACEFIAYLLASHVKHHEQAQALGEDSKRRTILNEIEKNLDPQGNTLATIKNHLPLFQTLVNGSGIALINGEEIFAAGRTPAPKWNLQITQWLKQKSKTELFSSDFLKEQLPDAIEIVDTAKGLLALRLHEVNGPYLIWFRTTKKEWKASDLAAVKALKNILTKSLLKQLEGLGKEKAELEHIQQELELRVAERTKELARLNKLLQEEIRERKYAEEVIVQATKLSALGEMAAGIAHEINNPLTVIQGRAFQLARGLESKTISTEDAINMAQKIIETAQRISKITTGLRAFAREGSDDPVETTLVKTLLDDTLSFCESRLRNHGIELRIEPYPENLTIVCRAVQISQVLLNLISNAHDAIENLETKWIQIRVEHKDGWVHFWVSDSGRGIPANTLSHIFDPFFTTKRLHKGTGLGLSIARGIVDKHAGRLDYIPAEHTTFRVSLPQYHQELL